MKNSIKESKTVCVIGAMECEIKKIKEKLNNIEEIKYNSFNFYKGKVNNKTVILAQSGVGKVAAASCTQLIIDKYNPDYIINTGVAGGLADNLNIGDIVIADKLVQHDFNATDLGYARGYICNGINSDEPTYFYADKDLIKELENKLNENLPELKYHIGTIASGDEFIGNIKKNLEIKTLFNATAVEMEGAAIAHCATLNNIPFITIRAISDLAKEETTKNYQLTEEDFALISAKTVEMFINTP